jgi:hypothetical protein
VKRRAAAAVKEGGLASTGEEEWGQERPREGGSRASVVGFRV